MKIRYGDSVMKNRRPVDTTAERAIDFNVKDHDSPEAAARAFHAALVKLIEEAKPDDTWFDQDPDIELAIWEPGERTDMTEDPTAWGVCWEAGPEFWAYMTDAVMTKDYETCPGPWSFVMLFYPRRDWSTTAA